MALNKMSTSEKIKNNIDICIPNRNSNLYAKYNLDMNSDRLRTDVDSEFPPAYNECRKDEKY